MRLSCCVQSLLLVFTGKQGIICFGGRTAGYGRILPNQRRFIGYGGDAEIAIAGREMAVRLVRETGTDMPILPFLSATMRETPEHQAHNAAGVNIPKGILPLPTLLKKQPVALCSS